jgi:hypothetical protein
METPAETGPRRRVRKLNSTRYRGLHKPDKVWRRIGVDVGHQSFEADQIGGAVLTSKPYGMRRRERSLAGPFPTRLRWRNLTRGSTVLRLASRCLARDFPPTWPQIPANCHGLTTITSGNFSATFRTCMTC